MSSSREFALQWSSWPAPESNTIAVTETKTVLLRRRAQVGVEETGPGGHFSLESIARWGTLGSQEERL